MTQWVPIPIPSKNPYLETRYGFLPGLGLGSPEIPQGYPLQSLVICEVRQDRSDVRSGKTGDGRKRSFFGVCSLLSLMIGWDWVIRQRGWLWFPPSITIVDKVLLPTYGGRAKQGACAEIGDRDGVFNLPYPFMCVLAFLGWPVNLVCDMQMWNIKNYILQKQNENRIHNFNNCSTNQWHTVKPDHADREG